MKVIKINGRLFALDGAYWVECNQELEDCFLFSITRYGSKHTLNAYHVYYESGEWYERDALEMYMPMPLQAISQTVAALLNCEFVKDTPRIIFFFGSDGKCIDYADPGTQAAFINLLMAQHELTVDFREVNDDYECAEQR